MFRGHWLLPAAGITRMPPPDACSAVSVDVRFARAHTGAASRNRTRDQLITNQTLYQLSYDSVFNSYD